MTNTANLKPAVQALANAIEDEGISPSHHHAIMHRSRIEWPALWTAIDGLLAAFREQPKPDARSGPTIRGAFAGGELPTSSINSADRRRRGSSADWPTSSPPISRGS